MTTAAPAEIDELIPAAPGLKTDSLAASVLMLLILTVVQRLVGFLRGILFCRWLDAEQLGQWYMAFGFLMLAAPLAVLGLPGSFGRYVESYRRRGQLKPLLRRTSAGTLLLSVLAVILAVGSRSWLSRLVFGSDQHADLVLLMAAGLGAVIAYNFLASLYTALRQIKIVSIMQFAQSILFAVLGVGLLLLGRVHAASVVIAFCAACLLCAAGSLVWLRTIWQALPQAGVALPHRALWARLLPFAILLWVTNCLSNLFGIADRFMILHISGLPPEGALSMVGQYHTARIFPVLLVGVAELVASVVTPHLSADWEAGHRGKVSQRLRLIVKTVGLGLTAAAILVLLGAPVLFNTVWQHRYVDGLRVLPWAMVFTAWAGLAAVSYNYFWCAEKSRFVIFTLLFGLALNTTLNLLLLPRLGLLGAALATALAQLGALGLLWWFACRLGMTIDRGLLIVAALPLALALGPWVAMTLVVAVLLEFLPGLRCFDAYEKQRLADTARQSWLRLKRLAGRRNSAAVQ
jgi:O-antigen/teichoic acid export membrane protein